jgi:hypothetical protein
LILVTALICTSVVANALQAPACRTFTAEEVAHGVRRRGRHDLSGVPVRFADNVAHLRDAYAPQPTRST